MDDLDPLSNTTPKSDVGPTIEHQDHASMWFHTSIAGCFVLVLLFAAFVAPRMASLGMTKKVSEEADKDGFRARLGEIMEGKVITIIVLVLILVDLTSTVINDLLENTNLLNPKYHEQGELWASRTHDLCVTVLCLFLAEQVLHLIAFGADFFSHGWMVLDLVVVSVSLLVETCFEKSAEASMGLIIVLRLWKLVALVFDVFLAKSKSEERTAETKGHHVSKKLTQKSEEPRENGLAQLGEFLESPIVSGIVIILIVVDLVCTVINDTLENTDLLNPAYSESGESTAKMTHTICVTVLCMFLVEQLLHLLSFGRAFFGHFWMVTDLVVVSISLVCETLLEGTAENWASLLVALRLWKLVAFIFDMLLLEQERAERAEKLAARTDEG